MKSRNSSNIVMFAYAAVMVASVCLLLLLFRAEAEYPSPVAVPANMAQDGTAQALQSRIAAVPQGQLTLLYQARNFRPLWMGRAGLSVDRRHALAILAAADGEALPATHYAVSQPPDARAPDAGKADFDIALTGAMLRYAADMRWGA